MLTINDILIFIIALLHIYILILEMFLWEKPIGLRAFRNTPEKAALTRVLAANQGLYNGFLAAGLLWGLWLGTEAVGIKLFFLICIAVAGIFGALTAAKKILYIQTLPALFAILCLLLGI
jgi:putative membrane protein